MTEEFTSITNIEVNTGESATNLDTLLASIGRLEAGLMGLNELQFMGLQASLLAPINTAEAAVAALRLQIEALPAVRVPTGGGAASTPTAPLITPTPPTAQRANPQAGAMVVPIVDIDPARRSLATIAKYSQDAFNEMKGSAKKGGQGIVDTMQEVSDKLVGHSIVPDMVAAINAELNKIGIAPMANANLAALQARIQEVQAMVVAQAGTPMVGDAGLDTTLGVRGRLTDYQQFLIGPPAPRAGRQQQYMDAEARYMAESQAFINAAGPPNVSQARVVEGAATVGPGVQMGTGAGSVQDQINNLKEFDSVNNRLQAAMAKLGSSTTLTTDEIAALNAQIAAYQLRIQQLYQTMGTQVPPPATAAGGAVPPAGGVPPTINIPPIPPAGGGGPAGPPGNQYSQYSSGMSAAEIKKLQKELKDLGDEADKAGKKGGLMASSFGRHLVWMAQGMVLWQGIGAIKSFASTFVEQFNQIEQAAARTAFVVDSTTENMIASQTALAGQVTKYGINVADIGPGMTTMGQYGVGQQDFGKITQDAAKLAMTGQMDMAASTNYLMSIERQWNIEAGNGARVLNTLATMYKNAPGSMTQFLELMQEGPALADQMGQSFEENMMLIARAMSYLPNRTPTAISSTFGRMLSRVQGGEISGQLASKYGITPFDLKTGQPKPGLEIMDEIAAKMKSLRSDSEKAALAILVAGSRQGSSWRDMLVMLNNWQDGIRSGTTQMESFDTAAGNVGETLKTKFGEANSELKLTIQHVGSITGATDTLKQVASDVAAQFREIRDEADALMIILDKIDKLRGGGKDEKKNEVVGAAQSAIRGGPFGGYLSEMGNAKIIREWLTSKLIKDNPPGGMTGSGGGMVGTAIEAAINTAKQALDQSSSSLQQRLVNAGFTFHKEVLSAGIDFRKATLTNMLATGWAPSTSIIDLTGPKEHPYTQGQVNKAIVQSASESQKLLSVWSSFLTGPEVGLKKTDQGYTEYMSNLAKDMQLQLQFYRLPTGEIRLMEGRDILSYLGEIADNTEPLEGIWNVPEGMRIWVPIESTYYGHGSTGGGGYGGGTATSAEAEAAMAALNRMINAYAAGVTEEAPSKDYFANYFDKFFGEYTWPPKGAGAEPMKEKAGQEIIDSASIATAVAMSLSGVGETMSSLLTAAIVPAIQALRPAVAAAQQSATSNVESAVTRAMSIVLSLTPISKGAREGVLTGVATGAKTLVDKVQQVSLQPSQVAMGVTSGTLATGMPVSMSSVAMSARTMTSYSSTQLSVLRMIEANTRYRPPPINATAGASSGIKATAGAKSGTSSQSKELYDEFKMSPAAYEVAI